MNTHPNYDAIKHWIETPDDPAMWRLIYAITHPETIEGYEAVDPDDCDVPVSEQSEVEVRNA